jgi:hypothetical protein
MVWQPTTIRRYIKGFPSSARTALVEIPFGYQNGRFNLIAPVRFGAENPEQSVVTACKYAVEGRSIYDSIHPARGAMQLLIVGQFRAKDQDTPGRVRRVFDEHSVKLFKMDDLPELIDEIRRTGKEIVQTEE